MSKNRSAQIRRVYGVLLSVSIVIAGLCLIGACVGIYRTEGLAFSREAVAAAFQPISVPVYLCLGLVILSFPLSWWLPGEDKKPRAERQDGLILRRLQSKTDLNACEESLRAAVAAPRKSRAVHSGIRTALLILSGIVFLAYVFSADRFVLPDINGSMIRAMRILLPCLAVTFAYAVFTAYHNRASLRREIALMKQANAQAPKKAEPQPKNRDTRGNSRRNVLRSVIALAAAVLLLYGFFSGGTADVLTKAINICTECVGLG